MTSTLPRSGMPEHFGIRSPASTRTSWSASSTSITGVVAPVHVGRRTIVVQTSIYRADGKLAVITTQAQLVLPRDPPDPG